MESVNLGIRPVLLEADRKILDGTLPVRVVDIYEGATKEFHPLGLFSKEIFGPVGSPERLTRMSYIDLKIKVFNPVVFKHIEKLKGLYVDIMSGRGYAKWNPKLKDFERTSELEGRTGFSFFVEHFRDIKIRSTGSDIRELRKDIIDLAGDDILRDTLPVSAAGSRDIITDDAGRDSKDEVNDWYQSVIAISNNIIGDGNESVHDTARWSMQRNVNLIYDYYFDVVFGKNKQIQSNWASRKVAHGTRNVITSMSTHSADLDDFVTPEIDTVMLGCYQHAKSVFPKTVHAFLKGIPARVVDRDSSSALVFDRKTGKPVTVTLTRKEIERWTTSNGVNKLLNRFGIAHTRMTDVEIGGHTALKIYRTDKVFRLVTANEVANGLVPDHILEHLRPVKWIEFLYALIYRESRNTAGVVTRYPVSGEGSTYPARVHLRSTVISDKLIELNEEFEEINIPENTAICFPIVTGSVAYFDSLSIHPANLVGAGADFDGDMMSWTAVYTKEATQEIFDYLDGLSGFLSSSGGSRLGVKSDLVEWVFRGFTLHHGL